MTDTSDEVVPFLKNHLDAHGGTDGAASISVNASFPAEVWCIWSFFSIAQVWRLMRCNLYLQLLSLIKAELQLPFDVKLMYPVGHISAVWALTKFDNECTRQNSMTHLCFVCLFFRMQISVKCA
eukprot:SAG31_NODE_672_length_12933_cov_3.746143_1_plen_124_part_00